MLRKFVGSLVVCVLLAPAGLFAAEIRGTVKSVDPAKNSITVTTDGKDQTLTVAKNVQVMSLQQFRLRRTGWVTLSGGLNNVSQGTAVTLVTQAQNGQDTVTEIRQEGFTTTTGRRRLIR